MLVICLILLIQKCVLLYHNNYDLFNLLNRYLHNCTYLLILLKTVYGKVKKHNWSSIMFFYFMQKKKIQVGVLAFRKLFQKYSRRYKSCPIYKYVIWMEHLSLDQFDTAPQTTGPWKIASISKNKSKKKMFSVRTITLEILWCKRTFMWEKTFQVTALTAFLFWEEISFFVEAM